MKKRSKGVLIEHSKLPKIQQSLWDIAIFKCGLHAWKSITANYLKVKREGSLLYYLFVGFIRQNTARKTEININVII